MPVSLNICSFFSIAALFTIVTDGSVDLLKQSMFKPILFIVFTFYLLVVFFYFHFFCGGLSLTKWDKVLTAIIYEKKIQIRYSLQCEFLLCLNSFTKTGKNSLQSENSL